MEINWFPGHMTKALREMKVEIDKIDVVIYLLDSRAPLSCFNPELEKLAVGKPILFVLNKTDLADEKKIKSISDRLKNDNTAVVYLDSRKNGNAKQISDIIFSLAKAKVERLERKGVKAVLRAIVVGVPNSGKSTFINSLCAGAKTVTGNKPGVTKGKQWVRVSDYVEILDTPGTLWPKLSNQNIAKNLAFIGSIKDDVVQTDELSIELITRLEKDYYGAISTRYGIVTNDKTSLEILEEIAVARKFLLKGGEIDYDRASASIIDDFRKGRLGKITLD